MGSNSRCSTLSFCPACAGGLNAAFGSASAEVRWTDGETSGPAGAEVVRGASWIDLSLLGGGCPAKHFPSQLPQPGQRCGA